MKALPESLSWEQSMASVLEKLRALNEQRSKLLDEAKKEALEIAEKAVADLNELGFHFTLNEDAPAAPRGPRRTATQGQGLSVNRGTSLAPSVIIRQILTMTDACIGIRKPRSLSTSRNLWKRA
jgi:hypothetical protein